MEYMPTSTSAPAIFAQYKPTWDQVRNPKHPSTTNRGSLSPKSHLPNDLTQPIMDATSITAQSPSTRVHISWGDCGKPGSFTHRRFLEEMAEEVAVQEGFEHAKILSIVHSHTSKGTRSDAAHWVGEFGPVPGARVVKAHVYVLSNHQRGKKHRGKRLKNKAYYERSALGDIIYQKEWKTGVKHVHR